jgi:hypothetical protein
MSETTNPLPPLSHEVLQEVLRVQDAATRGLKDCGYGGTATLNEDKAIEILCAGAIKEADLRFQFHQRSRHFCIAWANKIAITAVESMLACFPQQAFIVPRQTPMIGLEGEKVYLYEEPSRFVKAIQDSVVAHLKECLARRAYVASLLSGANDAQSAKAIQPPSREALAKAYRATYPDAKIRDICWAAGQHYREWRRWLGGTIRDGLKPDRAFRQLLSSSKSPIEFNPKPRPPKWE